MTDSLPSLVVNLQGFDLVAGGHLAHLELGTTVELDLGEVRMQRRQRVGDHAPHFALAGVNRELGLDMLDVEEPDALGLPGSAGLGERSPRGAAGPGLWAEATGLIRPTANINKTLERQIALDMVFPDRVE